MVKQLQGKGNGFRPDKAELKNRLLQEAKDALGAQLVSETITHLDFLLFGTLKVPLENADPISFSALEWAALPQEIRTLTTIRLQLLGYSFKPGERTWYQTYSNPMVKLESWPDKK